MVSGKYSIRGDIPLLGFLKEALLILFYVQVGCASIGKSGGPMTGYPAPHTGG